MRYVYIYIHFSDVSIPKFLPIAILEINEVPILIQTPILEIYGVPILEY